MNKTVRFFLIKFINIIFIGVFTPILVASVFLIMNLYGATKNGAYGIAFWLSIAGMAFGFRAALQIIQDTNGPIQKRNQIIIEIYQKYGANE